LTYTLIVTYETANYTNMVVTQFKSKIKLKLYACLKEKSLKIVIR